MLFMKAFRAPQPPFSCPALATKRSTLGKCRIAPTCKARRESRSILDVYGSERGNEYDVDAFEHEYDNEDGFDDDMDTEESDIVDEDESGEEEDNDADGEAKPQAAFDDGDPYRHYHGPELPPEFDEDEEDLLPADFVGEDGKPMWLKDLEADIENDPEVRGILDGTDGDPEKVRMRMRARLEADDQAAYGGRMGSSKPMRVTFREINPAHNYFWMELYQRPSEKQVETLNEVIRSWFVVGKLGGYNALNLQVHAASSEDLSFMPYRQERDGESVCAMSYHELSELECKEKWVRFWADLGTADEIGFDILINTIQGFSREYLGIKQLCIGGENDDWPTPDGDQPELTMNPMRAGGAYEDDEWDEAEDANLENLLEEVRKLTDPETMAKLDNLKALQGRLDGKNFGGGGDLEQVLRS